ncbi:hypothetical protein GQ607_007186 [Colletotrichum asianum]|uniref:Uncharacterized protein n=1 Tax=Colletotrichum asianum TaxID=702518 RepID=A0A8H3ZVL3_9PEZI|nr:hypothetical protein GQ607_007186 [Colletotrichum asianum]
MRRGREGLTQGRRFVIMNRSILQQVNTPGCCYLQQQTLRFFSHTRSSHTS